MSMNYFPHSTGEKIKACYYIFKPGPPSPLNFIVVHLNIPC